MGLTELVLYIRENFEKKYAENIANGLYDDRDLQRLQNDFVFTQTFIRGRERLDEGVDLVHAAFKFRKETQVHELNEEMFGKELWELGGMYFRKKDIHGNRILWLRVKVHRKDASAERLKSEKKGLIFALEKAFNEAPLQQVVVLLDMTSCGLANLDIDFVKYIITVFKFYYPTFLAYMLIYDMPWIFNAAWKVIKAWLSAEAAAKIKFVTKGDVHTYIVPEDLPLHMGGTDEFEFVYTPGMSKEPLYPEDEDKKSQKKVTFEEAESGSPPSTPSISNADSPITDLNANASSGLRNRVHNHADMNNSANNKSVLSISKNNSHKNTFVGRFLSVSPAEELTFEIGDAGDAFDIITLSNTLPFPVAFKVKTTSPEKYRVRPSSGNVKSGKTEEVYVYLVQDQQENVTKDKFLIMAMEVGGQDLSDIAKLWKNAPKESIMEHKLRCSIAKKETKKNSSDTNLKTSQVEAKVDRLELQNQHMQRQLNLLLLIQLLTAITFILMMLSYSCFGEELFTRFLALPFDICSDNYGRKC